jgi:NAD(P)-dependent dehydrogenase (short-subunit alcohol dehydrogenase family)
MGRLEGKVAIISGASSGQGRDEVKLFCDEGAKVIFGDIQDEKGKALETEVRNSDGEATYVHLDVTSESDWQKAVSKSVELYGKLDILINNAGVFLRKNLEDTTEEEWDFVQSINSKGVFLGVKSVISAMKESGGGSIVNISSMAGLVASSRAPAYGASKGAVRLLTKSIAVQYGSDGIRCNSVHPGLIEETGMGDRLIEKAGNMILAGTPLGIYGTPRDIALGVLFLASDESSYITGSELVIDGGITAK